MRLPACLPILLLGTCFAPAYASTWTVLVYMAADNELWEEALDDLSELEEVGSTPEVTVVAQVDLKDSPARRLLIQRYGSKLIADLGEVDMGDPDALADFGAWGVMRYPADHYLFVIWDHGNGWFNEIGPGAGHRLQASPPVPTAIGYDRSSGNSIGVANGELREALLEVASRLGAPVDVLGLDACSMQLAEVACEIKDAVRLLIGSEEIVPLDGWPYDEILRLLTSSPDSPPTELASSIVHSYIQSYSNGSQGSFEVTLSAVDSKGMGRVEEALERFSRDLLEVADELWVQVARKEVQAFHMGVAPPFLSEDFIDLTHFAHLIGRWSSGELGESALSLAGALDSAIVSTGHRGEYVDSAYGLSVWYPEDYLAFVNNHLDYRDLDLAQATAWEEFLYRSYGVPDTIAPTMPEISSVGFFSANSFTVRWLNSYDLSGVSSYELREISDLVLSLWDDCEGSTAAWDLAGFIQSQGNCHSPARSYFSHKGEMTTRRPIPVSAGGELSLWCCRRGREGTDFLLVEISSDGLAWQSCDSLSGAEPNWKKRRYDLCQYAGEDIYIRFRYESDGAAERWVYIDDIEVNDFPGVETLCSNIQTNFYPVLKRGEGVYYYQVRATDPYGNLSGWSDFGVANVPGLQAPFNYPNPFGAGGTTIQLSMTNDQIPISLKVYDLSGRLVTSLLENEPISDFRSPVSVFWDGRDHSRRPVTSGVYFYVLDAGLERKTGKAICIR